MKTLFYLVTAAGLIGLGALGTVLLQETVAPYIFLHDEVDTVEFIPDSGPGWAVPVPRSIAEPRVRVAEPLAAIEGLQESIPLAREVAHQYAPHATAHNSMAGNALTSMAPLVVLMAMLLITALIALKWKLNQERREGPTDSVQIMALHRHAQSLADRMESLETILLERGPHGH